MTYPPGPDDRPDPSRYPGPPPPPPGYGPPPGYVPPPQWGPPPFSVGEAIGYGWAVFTGRVGTWLGVAACWGLVVVLVSAVLPLAIDPGYYTTSTASGDDFSAIIGDLFAPLDLVVNAVGTVLGFVASVGLARVALDVADHRPTSFGRAFTFSRPGTLLAVAVLFGVASQVGILLCLVPGLALAWFGMFLAVAVADGEQGVAAVVRASFGLVARHPGPTILLFLLQGAVLLLGFIACGVGALVAFPVTSAAGVHAYRRLNGRPVWA